MVNILLIGGPGSGKGTLAKYLKEIDVVKFYHISTGELFRGHMVNDTEIGKKVKEVINSGGLVNDEITVDMMTDAVDDFLFVRGLENPNNLNDYGIIFDGFPRKLTQGPMLFDILDEYGFKLDMVIYLDTTDEILLNRLKERSLIEDRAEDSDEEYSKKRIAVFREQTLPLIDYYKESGILYTVDASKSIDEVNADVLKYFKK